MRDFRAQAACFTKLYSPSFVFVRDIAIESMEKEIDMHSRQFLATCLICFSGAITPFYGQTITTNGQSSSVDSTSQSKNGWPTPEETVTRMSSKLNLSDDQKNQMIPIIANRQTQMKALMADTSGRRMQKARKAKSIMSDSDKKIEGLLTNDQKKTYEEMKEQMREQMRSGMQQRSSNPQQ